MSYIGANKCIWKASFLFLLINSTDTVQYYPNIYGNGRINFPNPFSLSRKLKSEHKIERQYINITDYSGKKKIRIMTFPSRNDLYRRAHFLYFVITNTQDDRRNTGPFFKCYVNRYKLCPSIVP